MFGFEREELEIQLVAKIGNRQLEIGNSVSTSELINEEARQEVQRGCGKN
jgi:hypothetical protein